MVVSGLSTVVFGRTDPLLRALHPANPVPPGAACRVHCPAPPALIAGPLEEVCRNELDARLV